jgi:hypothetical protein
MNEPEKPQTIRVHYIKSGGYRAIHADGAICGVVPSRGLHVAFFSERAAIPQSMEHRVMPDGSLGEVLSKIGKDGVVREIEIDAFMDATTAQSLVDAITNTLHRLAELERKAEQP